MYTLCSNENGTDVYGYYAEDISTSILNKVFKYSSKTINGQTCYYVDSECKDGYTNDASKRKDGGACYIYGDETCYEAEEEDTTCPEDEGYYYSASKPLSLAFTFTAHESKPNCYKASCNTSNGWTARCLGLIEGGDLSLNSQTDITISPSAVADLTPVVGDCEQETWNGLTCYLPNSTTAPVCPDGYDKTKNYPTYMTYETITTDEGVTCYKALTCNTGYTQTSGTCYTDNGLTCCSDPWATTIYYTIDCSNMPTYAFGSESCTGNVAECRTYVTIGSEGYEIITDRDYSIVEPLTYGVQIRTQEAVLGRLATTFPLRSSRLASDVYGFVGDGAICCGDNSNLHPCSKMSLYDLYITSSTGKVYNGTGGDTMSVTITDGTESRKDTYNVKINFKVPSGW